MANKVIQGFTRDETTGALLVTGVGGGGGGAESDPVALAALTSHEADTTNIHGIVDTANLVLTNDARLSDARIPIYQEAWKPSGIKYENFRRDDCVNVAGIASGLMQATGPFVLKQGDPITSIGMWSGATPATTPTNQWFFIQDASNDQVVAVTGDDGTNAWGSNTLKTISITGGPWSAPSQGNYRVGVCVVAATPPSFFGKTGTSTAAGALSSAPKIVGGEGTARTGPVAVGTVLTFSTLESRMPYFQLS